jgi:hypothetical protein
VLRVELHLLEEECCDFGEVVFDLLVGVWVRGAALHCVAHDGKLHSIEEAEENGTRHFVLCGGGSGERKKEIRTSWGRYSELRVKWGRVR